MFIGLNRNESRRCVDEYPMEDHITYKNKNNEHTLKTEG